MKRLFLEKVKDSIRFVVDHYQIAIPRKGDRLPYQIVLKWPIKDYIQDLKKL